MRFTIQLLAELGVLAGATGPVGSAPLGRYRQSIISCMDVCVAKAAAPKPGQVRGGHLVRQCYNTLTGQYVGERAMPYTPCVKGN